MEFHILENSGIFPWKTLWSASKCKFEGKPETKHSRFKKYVISASHGSVPHSSTAFDVLPQSCKVMQQIFLWISSLSGRSTSKVSRFVRKFCHRSQPFMHLHVCHKLYLVYIKRTKASKPTNCKLFRVYLSNDVHIPECTAISKHVEPKGKVGTAKTATEINVVALALPTEGEIHFA